MTIDMGSIERIMSVALLAVWFAALVGVCAYQLHKPTLYELCRREYSYWFDQLRNPMLRDLCRNKYGDWFVECMDMLCDGRPIGRRIETIAFLNMVEKVKSEHAGEWRNK